MKKLTATLALVACIIATSIAPLHGAQKKEVYLNAQKKEAALQTVALHDSAQKKEVNLNLNAQKKEIAVGFDSLVIITKQR